MKNQTNPDKHNSQGGPVVSIIVPLFNKAPYIEQCLASLAAQTLTDIEVIIIDDGSTDGGGEIAAAFCDNSGYATLPASNAVNFSAFNLSNNLAAEESSGCLSNRVHFSYIRHENSGVSTALNRGLAHASGNYIGRVDADDWVEPEMYQLLVDAAKKYDAPIARCGYLRQSDTKRAPSESQKSLPDSQANGSEQNNVAPEKNSLSGHPGKTQHIPCCDGLQLRSGLWCFEKLFGEVFVPFMSACFGIYHRDLWAEQEIAYPSELTNLEDIYVNARLFSLDTSVVLIPECKYHYREVTSSLSQTADTKIADQLGHFEVLMQELFASLAKTSQTVCSTVECTPQQKHREPNIPLVERLYDTYLYYRSISVLTTVADLSVYGKQGIQSLADSDIYSVLVNESPAIKSSYPLSLKVLNCLVSQKAYSCAALYARILRIAKVLRRKLRAK